MKNVLVIGGSYFAGRVFVEELRAHGGYAVHVMNRGRRPLKLEGVTEIVCDRHDSAALSRVVPALEWDAVVDFCAYSPEDVSLLVEKLPGKLREYVFISTTTLHRNSLKIPMSEDTPVLTGPLPGPEGDYAYKKWLTELKLKELCEARGIAHVSLRPAFIYGKYNYAPRESYFLNLMAKDEPVVLPPQPQALFSMVSVWDVARICIACLGNEKVYDNAFIMSAEELISYDRLIEVLETIGSRKFNIQRQPIRLIEAKGIPLLFPLVEHLVYSGSRLRDILSYEYMSFLEGMTKTYNWFFKIEAR